jgi:hypothetical protein
MCAILALQRLRIGASDEMSLYHEKKRCNALLLTIELLLVTLLWSSVAEYLCSYVIIRWKEKNSHGFSNIFRHLLNLDESFSWHPNASSNQVSSIAERQMRVILPVFYLFFACVDSVFSLASWRWRFVCDVSTKTRRKILFVFYFLTNGQKTASFVLCA